MQDIKIDGRVIVPVRMIPFITGGQFSPDTVAYILGDRDDIHTVRIPSFYLAPTGEVFNMSPTEWDGCITELEELEEKGVDQSSWQQASVKTLPAGVFVYYDDLNSAYLEAYSPERMHLLDERPSDRQLHQNPRIPKELQSCLLEGFEFLHLNNECLKEVGDGEVIAENVFRRLPDGTWQFSFAGQAYMLAQELKGYRYIKLLLQNSGVLINADRLSAIVNHDGVAGTVDEAAIQQYGLTIGGLGNAGERLPAKTKREYQEVVKILNDKLLEAQESDDRECAEKLKDQIEFIESELKQSTGLNGREVYESDDFRRVSRAVSKATNEAIKYISRHFPALGQHLDESVSTGNALIYRPKIKIPWMF